MRSRARWLGLWVMLLLGGCRMPAADADGSGAGNGLAATPLPLQLQPAPAGLCEGGGSDKECGPEGCVRGPLAPESSAAPPGGFVGAGGSAASPSLPSGGSALPMTSPPTPVPGQPPVGVAPPTGGAAGGAPGVAGAGGGGGAGGSAAECGDLPDGGVLADGGLSEQCMEREVSATPSALIADDVPACATIDASAPSTLYLSADDSGSMAGPVIARRVIESGGIVPAHVLRPWEFLNYYDFSFQPAAPGQVRIVPQLSSCPEHDRLSLQVALQGEARDRIERPALNVTFVVDTSGSMGSNTLGGALPIDLAREAIVALAGQLRQGDVVSMTTWSTTQLEVLSGHVIVGPSDPTLLAAAQRLVADGGTDLHSGLLRGYELAQRNYTPERINRVILISDGIANVGVTDVELIASHADDEEGGQEGIYLAGVGVGDGFNDTLMNAVTDAGRGAYVYLDTPEEARRMLGARYQQVVDLSARSVRLEVTLPHYLVLEKFFGEVASTDAAKVRPQHLSPNDAMLFFQVLRACDPSLLRGDDRIVLRATWQTPFTRTPQAAVIDTTLNALAGDDDDLSKAAAVAGYAEALLTAATATPELGRTALADALADVRAAKDAATDPDLLEIARLLELYLPRF